eukprot:COSAG04_NODE_27772_length_280_cov_0.574586_1_plen_33_part_01
MLDSPLLMARFSRWANDRLLAAAATLSPEQLAQ